MRPEKFNRIMDVSLFVLVSAPFAVFMEGTLLWFAYSEPPLTPYATPTLFLLQFMYAGAWAAVYSNYPRQPQGKSPKALEGDDLDRAFIGECVGRVLAVHTSVWLITWGIYDLRLLFFLIPAGYISYRVALPHLANIRHWSDLNALVLDMRDHRKSLDEEALSQGHRPPHGWTVTQIQTKGK